MGLPHRIYDWSATRTDPHPPLFYPILPVAFGDGEDELGVCGAVAGQSSSQRDEPVGEGNEHPSLISYHSTLALWSLRVSKIGSLIDDFQLLLECCNERISGL